MEPDSSASLAAWNLRNDLAKLRRDWVDSEPEAAAILGRILFKKAKAYVCGVQVEYVAQPEQTVRALRELLEFRRMYLESAGLPVDIIMNDTHRKKVVAFMKKLYHARPKQQKMQLRDSCLPLPYKAKPFCKCGAAGASQPGGFGPNAVKMKKGKRSRWTAHLQRQYGHQAIVYFIPFTGRIDASLLEKVHATKDDQEKDDQDKLAEKRLHRSALKQKVHTATTNRRWAQYLHECLKRGTLKEEA